MSCINTIDELLVLIQLSREIIHHEGHGEKVEWQKWWNPRKPNVKLTDWDTGIRESSVALSM